MSNITLTLPSEVIRQARILAAQRNTSVSGLVTQMLRSAVGSVDDDAVLLDREKAAMQAGLLEVGPITWTRDEVHGR